ncbi:B-cell receptor CD22 [Danio aesculapii]|uniref:B-cell receptor CD22 n=1 Tax=Danio aesculapii TaxID=1142201 RepID=UPI0024BF323B|nr:B-cell receptor CD22 [Danio aesculapii]
MLVNMNPLSLLFIVLIAGVYGQYGFGVSYSSLHICALMDSTVTMSCTYRYPSLSSVITAFWTKTRVKEENEEFPDLTVDPEYHQRLQYLGDKQRNCNLRLSHVTKKDEREYYCRFTTEIAANKWIGIPGVNLSVTDLQLESPERVTEGDSVHLTCKSSCKLTDTPTFIWYRNSKPVIMSILNILFFGSISRDHAGNYRCGVQGNNYISPAVYLNVRYAPDTPVISISGPAVIMEGDSVSLNCSSDSNPPAEIYWYKGNTYLISGRIFNFSKVSSDDSGEYKCRATNDHGGKYSDPVTLNVKYPPRSISVSVTDSGPLWSDSVSLSCISDSNPPALNFSWFKENQSSAVGSGQSFSAVQSGRFYCEAHNPHGAQRSDAVTVTVRHSWHVWMGITLAFTGLLLIILIIVFIIRRKQKAPRAEDVNAKQDDLYSSITESGVRVSQSANCANAMYASVSSSKTGRDDNTEIQYATVQIYKKKPKKRTEENECHYDNIGIHQPDAAVRQSNVETVEEVSVIYSRVR